MKKQLAILTVLAMMFAMNLNAKVWRVSNRVINGLTVDADFTTLQSAINGASSGDTLYIMGSTTSYGDGVFDKQLVVIGPGYWLSEIVTSLAYQQHTEVGELPYIAGCEGSEIQGVYIYKHYNDYLQNWTLININADNITLAKNRIWGYSFNNQATGEGRVIKIGDRDNIIIKQNYIRAQIGDPYHLYNGSIYAIRFTGVPTNCIVKNNLIRAWKSYSYGTPYSIHMDVNDLGNDVEFYNNVIWGPVTTYYTIHVNNILVSGGKSGGGDTMMNNLCNGIQYPAAFGNQQNVDMTTVFVDHDLYIDNGYILTPGSPAIGAGLNGGDCGIFGYHASGISYVLSGLPAIPAIFETDVQTIGGNSVQVTVKAVSHNANK